MKMVGHGAVRVNWEIPCHGFGAENLEEPGAGVGPEEYLAPVEAADGDEIKLATDVAVSWKTNILVEVHIRALDGSIVTQIITEW